MVRMYIVLNSCTTIIMRIRCVVCVRCLCEQAVVLVLCRGVREHGN
jgi:hypothetical protein